MASINGSHAASMFGDGLPEGPEIGTLVVVVDRAKNLPNRKTIGKQDPYCAARLGKEAKKTATDIRGGQTPRWDQELRFIVYDSADYYQLKLSVFNDDRKAELIGETWIDLKNIVLPGGGQADLWQSLSSRGKYSGEIRIEMTYYDSRKPERAERAYRSAQQPVEPAESVVDGSVSSRVVKRRPLPTDPFGPREPPTPSHRGSQASLRKQPSYHSPADFGAPPTGSQRHTPADPYGTSPGRPHPPPSYPPQHRMPHSRSTDFGTPGPHQQQYPHSQQHSQQQYPHGHPYNQRRNTAQARPPDFGQDQRERAQSQLYGGERRYQQAPDMYGGHRSNPFPPQQDSELHLDSDKPPPPPVHRTRHNGAAAQEAMRNGGGQGMYDGRAPTHMRHGVLRQEAHRQSMANGSRQGYRQGYHHYDSTPADSMANGSMSGSDYSHPSLPRTGSLDTVHDQRSMQPTVEDAPESPLTWQPAQFPHTNRHSVQRSSLIYEVSPDLGRQGGPNGQGGQGGPGGHGGQGGQGGPGGQGAPGTPHHKTAIPAPLHAGSSRSRQNEQHHSNNFAASPRPLSTQEPLPPTARTPTTYHYSYTNNTYSQSPSPTADQAPSPTYSSPTYEPPNYGGNSPNVPARRGSFMDHNDVYGNDSMSSPRKQTTQNYNNYNSYTPRTPAPPTPNRRGSFMDDGMSHSPAPLARRGSYIDEHSYDPPHPRSPAPMRQLNYTEGNGATSPLPARERRNSALENYENALVHLPSAPPSLVPGVDPESAQEIGDRLKRLNSQFAAATATTRGRSHTDTYPSSIAPYRNDRGPSPSPYSMTPYTPNSFGGRSPVYESHSPAPAPAPMPNRAQGRTPSPMPNRAQGRTPSPLPSPIPSPLPSPRPPPSRMGGRQSVSPAPPPLSASPAGFSSGGVPFGPDSFDALNPSRGGSPVKSDAGSKIIASDGREIDPSDHLPVESWAPEPEAKPGQDQSPSRPSQAGGIAPPRSPHPPASGRRPLRISHRPSFSSSNVYYPPEDRATPLPPPAPGHSRLQKKSSRTLPPSPGPPPSRTPTHSHSHSQGNVGYRSPLPSPRAVPRTTTWDYANDHHNNNNNNHNHNSNMGGYGSGGFAHRSTISGPPAGPVAAQDWALMQEISQIDLGAGRSSRRHRGY